MAIKMVREPSETPNINNIDDIVPMRYAYGNQNGYVIGKGNEISNTVNGLNFTVNSGRLVLQGVECDIDATGVTITIDNIATKRYYTIYLEVNLGLNTATIKSEYDTATYPTIDVGDDLTENTTGVARLPLYRFTATSGIISEVNKVVESVKYAKDIKIDNAVNAVNAINAIINNDETYSGFTRNSDNVIQDGQNLLMTLKPLYVNKNGLIINKLSFVDIENFNNSININNVYFIVANLLDTPNGSETTSITGFYGAYFNRGRPQIDSFSIPLHIDPLSGTVQNNVKFFMYKNENSKLRVYLSEGYIDNAVISGMKLFGIYELQIPVRNSTN